MAYTLTRSDMESAFAPEGLVTFPDEPLTPVPHPPGDLHASGYFRHVPEKGRPNDNVRDVGRSVRYIHPVGIEKHTADPEACAHRIYRLPREVDDTSFGNPPCHPVFRAGRG